MKNTQLYLFLALVLTSAYCQFAGYNNVTVFGNDDPGACLLKLSYSVNNNAVTFTETVSNPNQDCTYQNLTFLSHFWLAPASGSVDLIQNGSQYKGKLTNAILTDQNGTACINVQPHGAGDVDVYVCRFKYGWNKNIDFFLAINATNGNFLNWTGSFFPLYGATVLVPQNGTTVWKTGNLSAADVVGQLYKDCSPNTWSTQISSASNEFYVTGSILASERISLQTMFTNIMLFSVIVKKRTNPKQYRTTFILNFAFNNAPINGVCSDVGMTYGQIVGGMNYCKDGCDVTIYMQGLVGTGLSVYSLRTSGFIYTGSRLLRA